MADDRLFRVIVLGGIALIGPAATVVSCGGETPESHTPREGPPPMDTAMTPTPSATPTSTSSVEPPREGPPPPSTVTAPREGPPPPPPASTSSGSSSGKPPPVREGPTPKPK